MKHYDSSSSSSELYEHVTAFENPDNFHTMLKKRIDTLTIHKKYVNFYDVRFLKVGTTHVVRIYMDSVSLSLAVVVLSIDPNNGISWFPANHTVPL